jgi:hypothetical protein
MRWGQRAGGAVLTVAVAALPFLVAAPAHAQVLDCDPPTIDPQCLLPTTTVPDPTTTPTTTPDTTDPPTTTPQTTDPPTTTPQTTDPPTTTKPRPTTTTTRPRPTTTTEPATTSTGHPRTGGGTTTKTTSPPPPPPRKTATQSVVANAGSWSALAPLASRATTRYRASQHIAQAPFAAPPAIRQAALDIVKAKPARDTAALPLETRTVNASAAKLLAKGTRAETHDSPMPPRVRTGLIALAALALLALLLVPRAPALLFGQRLDEDGHPRRRKIRRRGVVTMPAGSRRP